MAIQKSCFLFGGFCCSIATSWADLDNRIYSLRVRELCGDQSADIDQATSNLATVLEEAYTSDPNVTEETVAKNIMLYSFSEEQPASTRMKRSISSFSECMVIKMGLGQLKDVAKMVFNEQVVRYLKSQAWKKASAMIVQRITKFAGKKLASFAVKRLAHFALPGVGWVSVAWMGAQCGWDEIH